MMQHGQFSTKWTEPGQVAASGAYFIEGPHMVVIPTQAAMKADDRVTKPMLRR